MPNPLCLKCCKEMTCQKNGVMVLWYSGTEPYLIRSGDRYQCKNCGDMQMMGYSPPLYQHENGFQGMLNVFDAMPNEDKYIITGV